MLTIKVTQNTFLKQSPQFPEILTDNQKVLLAANQEFKIKSYFKQDKHYFVKLATEIAPLGKSGFLLQEHVQIEEIRGVWISHIDSDMLQSEANIKKGLQKLKELGFNTIYPVVWSQGFTFYKSPVAKRFIGSEVSKIFKGRDILAEIIQAAKGDFRIIPWFEYGLITPLGSPLEKSQPDWISLTAKKEKVLINDKGEKVTGDNCWLNPCHPEVQKFMTELIADLVERYDVDGIQLDDHFGMPASMGFDGFTQKLYKDETGGLDPIVNPHAEVWLKWRLSKMNNLLKQIYIAVKSRKEDCIISISPNPLAFSIKNYLSDWQSWQREGLVEELVLQVYRYLLINFEQEVDKIEVKDMRERIPTVIGIVTGLKPANKRITVEAIAAQVQATRQRNFAGFSFFFQGSLFDLGVVGDTPKKREDAFAQLLSTNQFG